MEVTLGIFITCFLIVLILTIYTFFIIHVKKDLMYDGMKFVFLVITLILIRMIIPVEFPFTITIGSSVILPQISRFLFYHIGGREIRLADILFVVWIAGCCINLYRFVFRQIEYWKCLQLFLIRDWNDHPMLKSVLEECGVPSMKVCILPMAVSPSIFGLKKSMLVLPDWEFSRNELLAVCRHEIEHHNNRDLWLKWFVELAVCIQWFNPLVYLLRRALILAFELSNDMEILKNSDEDQRYEYAMCIVDVARRQEIVPDIQNSLSFVGIRKTDVDTRVEFITSELGGKMKGCNKFVRFLHKAGVTALLVCSCLFIVEAYGTDEAEDAGTFEVSEENSYFIKSSTGYDWYVNDEYMYTFNPIPTEFADLPIVEEDVE